jgi:hypothetical protein
MREGVADGDGVLFTRRKGIISGNEGKSTGYRLHVVHNTHTVRAKRLQEKRRQVKPATATNHSAHFTFAGCSAAVSSQIYATRFVDRPQCGADGSCESAAGHV